MFKKYCHFLFYSSKESLQNFQLNSTLIDLNQNNLIENLQNDRILIVHIKTTFNNTILTLTNHQGQVLTWASAGSCGFKGTKKGTPFAAKKVVEIFIKKCSSHFIKCNRIKIYVCGIGLGRENALRGLEKISSFIELKKKKNKNVPTEQVKQSSNNSEKEQEKLKKFNEKAFSVKIILIREMTKIPHNGCRPPKKRRL